MKLKIHTDHKGIHVDGAENIGSTSDTGASTLKQFLRIAKCWYLTYARAFKEKESEADGSIAPPRLHPCGDVARLSAS